MKEKYFTTIKSHCLFSIGLVLLLFLGNTITANAQIRKNFTQRTSQHTPGKTIYNIKGDFTLMGNSNMTLQNYTDGGSNSNNVMIYSDVDSDSNTWNSSTAELKLSLENGADPTCSNIIYAGLYWTGRAHNDGNSPMSFDVTKDVPQTINVNEVQNLKHGEDINYSGYDLEVSREGGSNN